MFRAVIGLTGKFHTKTGRSEGSRFPAIAKRKVNGVLDAKPKKQAECRTAVWEHIAFLLADQISRYKTSKTSLEDEISKLITEISTQRTAIGTLSREIADLNKDCVNTTATIESVNVLLRDSGFQGFSIRKKEGTPNVYEVVRPDGNIAENLSEGERNFIAFLYFYHQVKGSDNPDGSQPNKIVVIDDPVSSMDSSALFIVSALVREMIQICENNAIGGDLVAKADYIKQIFILTHMYDDFVTVSNSWKIRMSWCELLQILQQLR